MKARTMCSKLEEAEAEFQIEEKKLAHLFDMWLISTDDTKKS